LGAGFHTEEREVWYTTFFAVFVSLSAKSESGVCHFENLNFSLHLNPLKTKGILRKFQKSDITHFKNNVTI
jgi:hypothetical protein